MTSVDPEWRRRLLARQVQQRDPPLWIIVKRKGEEVEEPYRPGFVSAMTTLYSFATPRVTGAGSREVEDTYLYDGRGLYNGGAVSFIREWTEARFAEHGKTASITFCRETIDSVRRLTFVERDEFNPPGFLSVANGVLDLTARVPLLVPHLPNRPTLMFTSRMPTEYVPTAGCPRFMAFLDRVVPDEKWRDVIQEFFGYCLKPGNPFKLAFFLVGPHDTGKSTLLEVLRGVLGPENTTTIALQNLADNRFASAGLFGKFANIYTDLSPKLVHDTGLFKMLTGGSDRVPAEKKFQAQFDFVNPAKLIFSANSMPSVPEADDAFFRRWAVIEFPNQVPLREQTPFYERLLLDEAPGILNWALMGLARLVARGRFDDIVLENTRSKWRRLSNSLAWFTDDRVERDRAASVTKADFYAAYTEFCEDNGVEVRSTADVGRELPQLLPGVHASVAKPGGRAGKSVKVWMGARIRSPDQDGQLTIDSGGDGADGSTGSTGSTPSSGIVYGKVEGNIHDAKMVVERVEQVEHDPEDLFEGRRTRADHARRNLRVGILGSVADELGQSESNPGRTTHPNCPLCIQLTHHNCPQCDACIWAENNPLG